MARKSNTEVLSQYRTRLTASKKWVEQEYQGTWNRLINLYRGKQYKNAAPYDRMLVNIAFSTINTLYPSVSIGRPKIVVSPRGPEDADKAIIAEAIVNYWWEHYECQEEYQLAVRDYLIIGHGWIKSGYRYVEEERVVEDSADELADENKPESKTESNLIIVEDRPFIERVDPMCMYVDPEGTTMKDIRWIAQRTRRALKDVKNDKRYDYAARQEVAATSMPKYSDNVNTSNGYTNDEGFCDVYEFYDLNKGTMCIFADGGDKFLVKPQEMPFAFGHPFTMIRNYDIPGFFYPMGDLEAIEPLQYELNETRTQMMNHRKRYSRKYLFKENAFDDFGRQALASDEDNAMVPVKGDENLGNVVAPMPALINPPDFYNQSGLIVNDIDRVTGISEYQRGTLPEIRRTATEASILQGAADSRAQEKLIVIERGIAKVATSLIKLAQQYMTEEQVVRVIDKRGQWAWVEFDRDYIDGDFDFTVEAGSTVPMNEGFRRQRALQIVDAMAPFAQAGIVKLEALAKLVLEQGFGVKDADNYFAAPQQQAPQQAAPMAPPEMAGLPPAPEGGLPPELAGLPPEVLAQMMAGGPAGPEMPMPMPAGGPVPAAPMPAGMEGLPPELAGLPPEVLQQVLSGAPLPPEAVAGVAGAAPVQLPPELASIPGIQSIPPEVVMSLPPEILAEITARGGFTPEVIAILTEAGIL